MYVDPNAPAPDTQSTRPSSAPGGMVGSSLSDIIQAADAGSLRVDQATGAATIQAITSVQDQLDTLRRLASGGAVGGTRLGGGYAEQIDRFNREWTVEGNGSAAEVMDQFNDQLRRLREAVQKSMASYQASDDSGERHINQAGGGR